MKKGLGKGLAALIGDLDDKADNQDEIIKKDNHCLLYTSDAADE